jgi:hypothetical protein
VGEWTVADAWVFAAIARDRPPRVLSLTEVIGIADGINHAVLRENELTAAVGRLLAAGLIDADPARGRYWLTGAGADLGKRWQHGLFDWIEAIPPGLRRLGGPPLAEWSLPSGVSRRPWTTT